MMTHAAMRLFRKVCIMKNRFVLAQCLNIRGQVFQYDIMNEDWVTLPTNLSVANRRFVAMLVDKSIFPSCSRRKRSTGSTAIVHANKDGKNFGLQRIN